MKSKTKRILAFLCAVVLVVTTFLGNWYTKTTEVKATDSVEPISLEGFQNVTLKNIDGMEPGIYTGTSGGRHEVGTALNVTSFDKVLLSMKVRFTGGTYLTRLDLGGSNENDRWTGFSLQPNADGTELYFDDNYDMTSTPDKDLQNATKMKADIAGVENFLTDDGFMLQLSFEYGVVTNNRANVTIGVYINGTLYNNQKFIIEDCDMTRVGNNIALYNQASDKSIILDNLVVPNEPVQVDGFTNLTISDFVDGSGVEMQSGEYAGGGLFEDFHVNGLDNFDNAMVSMMVKFEGGGYNDSILIGGNGSTNGWCGFNIRPDDDTGLVLGVGTTWADDIIATVPEPEMPSLSATTAGLTSFVNNEFLLQVSFEYAEPDTQNKADLIMGIYIDGKLYNNQKFTIKSCNMDSVGTHMALYRENAITVKSVKFKKFYGFNEVSIEHFVDESDKAMESKIYGCSDTVYGNYDLFKLKDDSSFQKKLLSIKVKFKEGGSTTRLDIGGSEKWSGLWVHPDETGNCLQIVPSTSYGFEEQPTIEIDANTAGVTNFINNEFLLQLTFNFDEPDGNNKANLQLGVYINGKQYNRQTYTITGCPMSKMGSYIGLYRQGDNSTIIVGSVNDEGFPNDPGIQPSARYEKLTFGDFGIKDKRYPQVSGTLAVLGEVSGRETLDQTVICGSIYYEGSNSSQIIWGGDNSNGWDGLRMFPKKETMSLSWYEGYDEIELETLSSEVAGVEFIGEKYDIMLSAELIANNPDEKVDDIKIGIWFNGLLYNQQYFIVDNVGGQLGDYFGVYCAEEGDAVTFGSVKELLEQPAEHLKKVTFTQFGVKDGTYESIPGTNVNGTYVNGNSINGTVLCGDVQLHNSDQGQINIFLGTAQKQTGSVWYGLRLTKYADSSHLNLIYQVPDSYSTEPYKVVMDISPDEAGIDLNKEFNLMWSMELIDNGGDSNVNDLKVGLWFNGFLYGYTCIDNYALPLENGFATDCGTGTAITLNAIYELSKLPDKNFDKITFSDFGLETQEVTCDGNLVAKAVAKEYDVLDKVVFSGDFRFAQDANYQVIYGGNGGTYGWNGLRVFVSPNWIVVSWYDGNDNITVAQAEPENVNLSSATKNTFNLMISTELVDEDGNGIDDIKVGVWFNEILYSWNGAEYHILNDWGDKLGNQFSIHGADGNKVLIRNVGDYQKNPYYYDEISSFRGDEKSYPEEPGYVFSGWYEDSEYTKPIEQDVTSGKAWAKFVEDDVLSVKPQIKVVADGSDADTKPDLPSDETDLRMATTVDSLDYRKISFFVAKEKNGAYGAELNTASVEGADGRLVYKKLYAIGDESTVWTYKPTAFAWQSEYFKTFTLTRIPKSDYDKMIKITPYWITMDGTLVRGKTLETCVNDYVNNISQAVSVDFIGDDTLPITGFNGPSVVSNADAMLLPDYITDEYFQMIAESGVNVIVCSNLDYAVYPDQVKKALSLGEKYGIGLYVQDGAICPTQIEEDVWNVPKLTKEQIQTRIAEYNHYESFIGLFLIDEPGAGEYATNKAQASELAETARYLKELGILTYVNMYPITDTTGFWDWGQTDKGNYTAYVEEVNTQINPVAFAWDYYPFAVPKTNTSTSRKELKIDKAEYFWNMAEIRRQAQDANKPFWAFVQAGSNWNDDVDYFNTTVVVPTEGQFRWNMNTSLAFGAQGIQYFPLIQPTHFAYAGGSAADNMWDFNRNGLIGAFGNKTQWYYYAQEANAHVGAMDHILMNSYNEKVIALGTAATDTEDLINDSKMDVTSAKSYKKLTGVSDNANVLIGCFDYKGKTALYVVNYNYDSAQNDIVLQFDGTSNITMYKNATETKTTGSSVELDMAAGEGILLVIE
ncbi:MAG: hypothetical protein IJE23_02040 [Tyzzerella sp.]|nr:hypothetical protein [Tyzzerella sp.]